jgi:undecaprenyl pyrophosphate phosphatase UppP
MEVMLIVGVVIAVLIGLVVASFTIGIFLPASVLIVFGIIFGLLVSTIVRRNQLKRDRPNAKVVRFKKD